MQELAQAHHLSLSIRSRASVARCAPHTLVGTSSCVICRAAGRAGRLRVDHEASAYQGGGLPAAAAGARGHRHPGDRWRQWNGTGWCMSGSFCTSAFHNGVISMSSICSRGRGRAAAGFAATAAAAPTAAAGAGAPRNRAAVQRGAPDRILPICQRRQMIGCRHIAQQLKGADADT